MKGGVSVPGAGMLGSGVDLAGHLQASLGDGREQFGVGPQVQVLRQVRQDQPALASRLEARAKSGQEAAQHAALRFSHGALQRGRRDALSSGLQTLDVWANQWQTVKVPRSTSCACCVNRDFRHLAASPSGTAVLCGRNAVQITPAQVVLLDLSETERRLSSLTKVRRNEYLLKASIDGCELTLFPDARAIIQGTDDPARARSLYARYVGA